MIPLLNRWFRWFSEFSPFSDNALILFWDMRMSQMTEQVLLLQGAALTVSQCRRSFASTHGRDSRAARHLTWNIYHSWVFGAIGDVKKRSLTCKDAMLTHYTTHDRTAKEAYIVWQYADWQPLKNLTIASMLLTFRLIYLNLNMVARVSTSFACII